MGRRVSADRSALFVLGAPHIQFPALFSSARQRIPIPALFPQRASAYQFLLLVFGTAQAHADSISFVFSAAQAHADPISFVFGAAQAHADPISFVFGAAQAHADAVLLCLPEFTHVRTSQGGRGPRPRAFSSWPVLTTRYGAAANLVVPRASPGVTRVPLCYRGAVPGEPLWPPRSYFHSCLPPRLSCSLCFPRGRVSANPDSLS